MTQFLRWLPLTLSALSSPAGAQTVVFPDETIVPADLAPNSRFGDLLRVDGRNMLVQCVERAPGAVVGKTIRFYRMRGGRWKADLFFTPAVALSPFNFFGSAPQLNGDWAALYHGGTLQAQGDRTYLFHVEDDRWSEAGLLDVSRISTVIGGPNMSGGGGVSAIAGDKMIVCNQAYALLYELSGGQWLPTAEVHPPSIPPGDPNYFFRGKAGFDGERLVATISFPGGSQGIPAGEYEWRWTGSRWEPDSLILNPSSPFAGTQQRLNDRWLVNLTDASGGSGRASIFRRDTANQRWVFHSNLRSPTPGSSSIPHTDGFGSNGFSLEGDRLLFGAEFHLAAGPPPNASSGAAFIYDFDPVTDQWECTRWLSTPYAQQSPGTTTLLGRGVGLFPGGAAVSDSIAFTQGVRTGAVHVYYEEISTKECSGSTPTGQASADLDVFGSNCATDPSLGFSGQIDPLAPYVLLGGRSNAPVTVPGLGSTPLCVSGPRPPASAIGTSDPTGRFEAGVDAGRAPLVGLLPGDSLFFQVVYRSQQAPGRFMATESRAVTFR